MMSGCKLTRLLILTAAVLMTLSAVVSARETVQIGIVFDGPWVRNDEISTLFQSEITDLLQSEFDVSFPETRKLDGSWTHKGVQNAIDELLSDRDIDIVLAMGVLASNEVARRADLPKPVIAPFVIDRELQGLPFRDGASGVANLNYVNFPHSVENDLAVLLEITPVRKLAFLVTRHNAEAIPPLVDNCRGAGDYLGIEVLVIPVDTAAAAVIDALPDDVDAVYVAPLLHVADDEYQRFIDRLIERKLPSFSLLGRWEVERGILASLNLDENFARIARRVALNMQRILLGERAGDLPVALSREEELTINMATARAIGVWPPWSVITEAGLINEVRTEVERHISLSDAVQEAVQANLDLAVADRVVAEGGESVVLARARLLPQIGAGATGTLIDKDRAAASLGSASERTLSGTVSATQVIYSQEAWANLSIQKKLQEARTFDRDRVRLDVAAEAATAYLNLLRAKSSEEIQKNNLKLTRTNLKLARVRESVGSAGPAEVYRWDSEIATGRKNVIAANSTRNQAEIALNRILHRPGEEPFTTADASLDDPGLLTANGRLLRYIDDPWRFRVFRRFTVQNALTQAPELRQIDAAISAQKSALMSAKMNVFWIPTIGVRGDASHRFVRGGAGSDGLGLDLPGVEFPQADDTDWSIGVSISIPLFSGGSRYAELRQAREGLRRLELERAATSERIEQRVRSALHGFGASYAAISLSRDAADAAQRNLKIVTDAYGRGVVSIIELLDAQNAARTADEVAAAAVYNFLIEMIAVERAAGEIALLATPDERNRYFDQLDAFFEEAGLTPRRQ